MDNKNRACRVVYLNLKLHCLLYTLRQNHPDSYAAVITSWVVCSDTNTVDRKQRPLHRRAYVASIKPQVTRSDSHYWNVVAISSQVVRSNSNVVGLKSQIVKAYVTLQVLCIVFNIVGRVQRLQHSRSYVASVTSLVYVTSSIPYVYVVSVTSQAVSSVCNIVVCMQGLVCSVCNKVARMQLECTVSNIVGGIQDQ